MIYLQLCIEYQGLPAGAPILNLNTQLVER